jgi:hypothetical protein
MQTAPLAVQSRKENIMKTLNKTRLVSGVRPTGHVHLGNYLWRRP